MLIDCMIGPKEEKNYIDILAELKKCAAEHNDRFSASIEMFVPPSVFAHLRVTYYATKGGKQDLESTAWADFVISLHDSIIHCDGLMFDNAKNVVDYIYSKTICQFSDNERRLDVYKNFRWREVKHIYSDKEGGYIR